MTSQELLNKYNSKLELEKNKLKMKNDLTVEIRLLVKTINEQIEEYNRLYNGNIALLSESTDLSVLKDLLSQLEVREQERKNYIEGELSKC